MLELRPYQFEALQRLWGYFHNGGKGNPIVVMPTGTGKSLVIAELFKGIYGAYPDQHMLMLTHRKELIGQNYEEILEIWPQAPAGIFSAGLKRKDAHYPITFAGIGSVKDRARLFQRVSIVVVDECHLVGTGSSSMYLRFFTELKELNPNMRIIGLTATPYRMGLGSLLLGGIFTDIVYDCSTPQHFQEFVKQGWLSKLIPKQTGMQIDKSEMTVIAGDYSVKSIVEQMAAQDVLDGALQEMCQLAHDRNKWLIFASSIDQTEEIKHRLTNMGVPTLNVHSKMSNDERDANIEFYRAGYARALVNQDILTTGFNVKEVDCIGMLRPTKSAPLWVQMLGRGTRPHPSKENCLVLDFAGNTRELGPIDDPLWPMPKGTKKVSASAPVKVCPQCMSILHTRIMMCSECGYQFPYDEKIDDVASMQALMTEQDALPDIRVFPVLRMTLQRHSKKGVKDGIKVSYYCGSDGRERFQQYIFPEHGHNFVRRKTRDWFSKHMDMHSHIPDTTTEALSFLSYLNKPTHIRVQVDKKYPEVKDHDFTDTAFGTKAPEAGFQLARAYAPTHLGHDNPRDEHANAEKLQRVQAHEFTWEDFK